MHPILVIYNIRIKACTLLFCLLPFLIAAQAPKWGARVQSPDKKLQLEFKRGEDNFLYYSFMADRQLLVKPSQLGLVNDGTLVLKSKQTKSKKLSLVELQSQ